MADGATTSFSKILILHIPRVKRQKRQERVSGSAGSVPSTVTPVAETGHQPLAGFMPGRRRNGGAKRERQRTGRGYSPYHRRYWPGRLPGVAQPRGVGNHIAEVVEKLDPDLARLGAGSFRMLFYAIRPSLSAHLLYRRPAVTPATAGGISGAGGLVPGSRPTSFRYAEATLVIFWPLP